MNFNDLYYLKLGIRLSDFELVKKLYPKTKYNIDNEVYEYINNYCTDLRIFKLFENNKNQNYNIIKMIRSSFNNFDIIKYYILKNNIDINSFNDNESILTNALRSINNTKKFNLFEFILNSKKINLNSKNNQGETNASILIKENPTDIDTIFIDKLEKATMNKVDENSYLFSKENILNEEYSEENIESFLNSTTNSIKINLEDIDYNLLCLNLKLRKMYDFKPLFLNDSNMFSQLNQIHLNILHNFILNKLILEKI